MSGDLKEIDQLKQTFLKELNSGQSTPRQLLKDLRFKDLFLKIEQKSEAEKRVWGQKINELRQLILKFNQLPALATVKSVSDFDVSAPFDYNQVQPPLLSPEDGSAHPILAALDDLIHIFTNMGFKSVESRQLDSQFYMFDSLNFPHNHPARDEFDNFLLKEKDSNDHQLLAPAHTSTMQNRVLKQYKHLLKEGQPIAIVIPGRVFRNEDVDATHDHMFYQLEGVFVQKNATVAHLITTLKQVMSAYFLKDDLKFKIQPFYFPFTEPSFEFAIECAFCQPKNPACFVCKGSGWLELLGCGMIHPNVLKMAQIDAVEYSGFAWGMGLNRLVMLKHSIEDIRHFASGKLDFLRQFKYEN